MDDELQKLLASTWDALVAATKNRTPFTLAQFGTVDLDGYPQVRAVILRQANPQASTLSFSTDPDSAKVTELAAHPKAALSFYNNDDDLQLRLTGTATVTPNPDSSAIHERSAWVTLQVETIQRLQLRPTPPTHQASLH